MKKWTGLIALMLVMAGCSSSNGDAYREEIIQFRKEKNKKFSNPDQSPLLAEDVSTFVGLQYYPVDSNFNIVAQFHPDPTKKTIEMPTTTERTPLYYVFGSAVFDVNDTLCSLVVYQEVEDPEVLFIPFNDYTNGAGTYGGGRYLDLKTSELEGSRIRLDFNKTYNPYCAYNYNYSCPIPPDTNMLDVAITAGEKSYKH